MVTEEQSCSLVRYHPQKERGMVSSGMIHHEENMMELTRELPTSPQGTLTTASRINLISQDISIPLIFNIKPFWTVFLYF